MTSENSKKTQKAAWKQQVVAYFGEKNLSKEKIDSFKHSLLATGVSMQAPVLSTASSSKGWSKILLSSVISAALAAGATFFIVSPDSEESRDPIAELTQLPGPKVYPPDFDLEGDSKALQDIVYELFADKDYFVSKLPAHVLAEYKPTEGRFFSWDGEPAVSIQMDHSNSQDRMKLNPDPATLFIVKLSEKSLRKFPKEKVTRKVAGSAGKMNKVKVWREGKYGYAMVQAVAVTESTP
jgi:hypothetical protein